MAEAEIGEFLTHLARDGHVAASTQNQALSAILFLYRGVLKWEIGWLDGGGTSEETGARANGVDEGEVHEILANLHGTHRLMAGLLYDGGLRLMEAVRLRVKDIDLGYLRITVRDGKGHEGSDDDATDKSGAAIAAAFTK